MTKYLAILAITLTGCFARVTADPGEVGSTPAAGAGGQSPRGDSGGSAGTEAGGSGGAEDLAGCKLGVLADGSTEVTCPDDVPRCKLGVLEDGGTEVGCL